MKKLFVSILAIFLAMGAISQTVRANEIVADERLYPPLRDTSTSPKRVGELRVRPADTSLYLAISMTAPKKWQKILKLTDAVLYTFTGLADGDMLVYDAGSQSFVNVNFLEIRWKARVGSTTSSGTPTINTDNVDIYKLTAQAADITSFTTNLSGTPNDGDILEIHVTGTATRAITWGSAFVDGMVSAPTTTSGTNTLVTIWQYFTTGSFGTNKWACMNKN